MHTAIDFYPIIQTIVSALLLGGSYGVISVGVALVWGVTKILNVAHAALALLVAYITYSMWKIFGLDPLLSLAISIPLMFCLGIFFERVIITPIRERGYNIMELEMISLIAMFGVSISLEALIQAIWGGYNMAINMSYFGTRTLRIGTIAIETNRLVGFVIALAGVAFLMVMLRATAIGKAIRATAMDPEMAEMLGIDNRLIFMLSFGLSGVLGACAGVSFGLVYVFFPTADFPWMINALLIVVLGGVGSIGGAFLAAIILAFVQSATALTLPFVFREIVGLVMVMLVILLRPRGLFGRIVR